MKKIAALFSIVVMLSQGGMVFSQSMSTPVVDSIYLKKSGSIAGKWLSTRTLQNIGVRASDTITRTKIMTRNATDSLYLVKKDTIARTKLMTRKATDSLYLAKTANRIKGTGAAGQVALFATADSIQGSNIMKVVTTNGVNNLVITGLSNFTSIPAVGNSSPSNIGMAILANRFGTASVEIANTFTNTTSPNGIFFGQYINSTGVDRLAYLIGMTTSNYPPVGSLILQGKIIVAAGNSLSANANEHELEVNGRGRLLGVLRLGGVRHDTTNYNHEFDGRTSTLTIRPRVDNTTAIQFTNSAKTLKPLIINTNNGMAYRNSVANDSMYTVKKDNDLLYLKLSDTITRTNVLTRKAADSLYSVSLVTAGSSSVGAVKYNGQTAVKGQFNGKGGLQLYASTPKDSVLYFNGVLAGKALMTELGSGYKKVIIDNANRQNTLLETYCYSTFNANSIGIGRLFNDSSGIKRLYVYAIGTGAAVYNTGNYVNAIGSNAAGSNTAGNVNAFGNNAAYGNTGSNVNAFGSNAASSNFGSDVNASGYVAAYYNTGSNVNAFGSNAANSNSGSHVNAFGSNAACGNTGGYINAIGESAAYSNSGNYFNAIGMHAAYINSGSFINAIGYYAANYNKADTVDFIGYYSGYHNASTAHSSVGIGKRAQMYNNWPSRVTIGGINVPETRFVEAPYTTKTFTDADVNTSISRITITSHGFGSTNSYINLKFKVVSGTAPSGLTNNGIYFFKVIDANTLELTDGSITSTGSGTFSLTRDVDRTSSVELGSGAIADTSYQVMLGNTSIRQVKTYGSFATEKSKTTVNGSTSGSAQFVMPFDGGSYKKVIIYCNALNGTASWTFPKAFTYTPVVLQTNGLPTTIVTTLTTTSVTVTGANSTGFLIIEGF